MPDLRTTLLAGLLSGGGAMAWTLFEFAMGWHNEHLDVGAKTGFVAVIFPVVAVGWALRRARQAGDGQLRWRSALAIGLGVSAISAAIDPTDKSMPPEMITKHMPTAMMPMKAVRVSTFITLS